MIPRILFVYLYLGAHYYPELSEDSRQNIFLFADELKTASFIHEEFDPETLANNIALIKLTETVEFGGEFCVELNIFFQDLLTQ